VLAIVMDAVLIVYALGLVVYMAMRRTQIRGALGIAGALFWGKPWDLCELLLWG
jgi:hypothetical protein